MDQPTSSMARALRRSSAAATAFVTSTLAVPALAAPVFMQRSLDAVQALPPVARYVLVASALVLLIAIPLKVMEARRHATPRFDGRDLRWWLNPEWRAAVYN